jgi:hypothetical protein
MTDAIIIRMAEETSKYLGDAHPFDRSTTMVGPYNALIQAARANHPDDTFLSVLSLAVTDEERGPTIAEMRALLAQLRIALESLRQEARSDPAGATLAS